MVMIEWYLLHYSNGIYRLAYHKYKVKVVISGSCTPPLCVNLINIQKYKLSLWASRYWVYDFIWTLKNDKLYKVQASPTLLSIDISFHLLLYNITFNIVTLAILAMTETLLNNIVQSRDFWGYPIFCNLHFFHVLFGGYHSMMLTLPFFTQQIQNMYSY